MKLRPSCRCAFSLVEVLLVGGLIGVLMALLLVTFNRIQADARAVQNIGNHREIARALIQSAADNNGVLPYCDGPGPKLSYPRFLVLGGYVTDYRVFYSPLARDWYADPKYNGAVRRPDIPAVEPWFYTNYGVNRRGAMPHGTDDSGQKPARLSAVGGDGNLSRLMLIRDTYRAGNDTDAQNYGGGIAFFSNTGWSYVPPEKKAYRGFVYATFADGHIQKFPRKTWVDDQSKPEAAEPYFGRVYTVY